MRDATPKHPQTEWVLCSDDWQDIVITHIPQLNNTPIEDNYADISLKKLKMYILSIVDRKDHTRYDQNNFTFSYRFLYT